MAALSWLDFQADAIFDGRPTTRGHLILEPTSDPFAICDGNDRCMAWAKWFVGHFHRLYPKARPDATVHLRRIFYALVSSDKPVPMVGSVIQRYAVSPVWVVPAQGNKKEGQRAGDTRPNLFANDADSWGRLCLAATWARHIGLIRGEIIADHRAPVADASVFQTFTAPDFEFEVDAGWGEFSWDEASELPEEIAWDRVISENLYISAFPSLPGIFLPAQTASRTHHLEIWVEKSTLNDILQPFCHRHGIVLQSLVGESSLTRTGDLMRRIQANGGIPTRIFYLSDFDPAGNSMPSALSRRVEHLVREEDPHLDVQVTPLALTLEQVHYYRLPFNGIKPKEKRAAKFMERFGVPGAVELDALEALHPGVLEQILLDAIQPYLDANRDYREAVDELERDIDVRAADATDTARAAYLDAHSQLEAEWGEAVEELKEEYRQFRARAIERLGALLNRLRPVSEEALLVAEDNVPDIDDLVLPQPGLVNESNPLLDTQREYLDQLDRYRQHKRKS